MKMPTLTALAVLLSLFIPALPGHAANLEPVRAQLRAKEETVLSAGISARISNLPFKEGESFLQNDVLISFDCQTEKAELQYAQAELRAAQATLKTTRELSNFNAVSTLDVTNSQARRDMADARIKLCESKIRACEENAPFPGRIARLDVKPHQRVNPGDPLMAILNPSVLVAELRVPSTWLGWLRVGQEFSIHIDEIAADFPVRLVRMGAQVDPVSQTVALFGELTVNNTPDNAQHSALVLPGMSGDAYFILPEAQNDPGI